METARDYWMDDRQYIWTILRNLRGAAKNWWQKDRNCQSAPESQPCDWERMTTDYDYFKTQFLKVFKRSALDSMMLHDFSDKVQEQQENLFNFGLRIREPIHRASKATIAKALTRNLMPRPLEMMQYLTDHGRNLTAHVIELRDHFKDVWTNQPFLPDMNGSRAAVTAILATSDAYLGLWAASIKDQMTINKGLYVLIRGAREPWVQQVLKKKRHDITAMYQASQIVEQEAENQFGIMGTKAERDRLLKAQGYLAKIDQQPWDVPPDIEEGISAAGRGRGRGRGRGAGRGGRGGARGNQSRGDTIYPGLAYHPGAPARSQQPARARAPTARRPQSDSWETNSQIPDPDDIMDTETKEPGSNGCVVCNLHTHHTNDCRRFLEFLADHRARGEMLPWPLMNRRGRGRGRGRNRYGGRGSQDGRSGRGGYFGTSAVGPGNY